MKILCVEDDEDISILMDNILSANGHYVTTCDNGIDGLSLIQKEDFNLILLDLRMPGFSGKNVINSLVKNGSITHHNIVILSADALEESEESSLKQKGVKEILQKPIRMERLLEVVKKFE